MRKSVKDLKPLAISLAAVCYVGAVAYGDIMFLQVMGSAFPTGLLGTLAIFGAVMTALSAITLVVAMHFWFAPGLQTYGGVFFWVVEIVVLALNAILAYQTHVGAVDTWIAVWRSLSPATPMVVVVGWGVVFMLDPSQAERHSRLEMKSELDEIKHKQRLEAANSPEVFEIVKRQAMEEAKREASTGTGRHPSEFSVNGHKDEPAPVERHPSKNE